MIIFGAMQLLFSQIPNLEEIWWLSIVAAVMSFIYATIGLGLSIGKATGLQLEKNYTARLISHVNICTYNRLNPCFYMFVCCRANRTRNEQSTD
jgi:hypothetical protein